MQNSLKLSLLFISLILTDLGFAQEKKDTIQFKKDAIKIPPLHISQPTKIQLRNAPDKFDFGKMQEGGMSSTGSKLNNKAASTSHPLSVYGVRRQENNWFTRNNISEVPITGEIDLGLSINTESSPLERALSALSPLSILAMIFGEDILRDPHQMPAAERYKFEVEWKKEQKELSEKKLIEAEEKKNKMDSTFKVTLQDTISKKIFIPKYVYF